MDETKLKQTKKSELMREWHDGYNCGIRHAESYMSRVRLGLVIAFAIGLLLGVNI